MKRLLICFLAITLVLCAGAAHAEVQPGYPVTFGPVPWFSAPEELVAFLKSDAVRWTDLGASAGAGRMMLGNVLVIGQQGLTVYGRRDIRKTDWGSVLWEGQAVTSYGSASPFAGTGIGAIYPIYAAKGDKKQLVSVTALLEAEAGEFAAVRQEISKACGTPQFERDGFCLWSDPTSQTDTTTLVLRVDGSHLYAIFAEADIEALLNSLI